jgi:hypothetical protein
MSDDATQKASNQRVFCEKPIYDWQMACFAALSEKDPDRLTGMLRTANAAIQQRLSRLEPWPDRQEMDALNEAVQALQVLRERSGARGRGGEME